MSLLKRCFIVLFLFAPAIVFGRTFKNAYISFEIKDNWKCNQENSEFICRSEEPNEAKEAVIILTAKETGPPDTFAAYNEHLSKPISTTTKSGAPLVSTVQMPPQQRNFGDQKWIDALHINSEVKNYYTRYLATVREKIAVLITFSAHSNFYAKHATHFTATINSLKLIASKDLASRPDSGPLRGSNEMLGAGIGQSMPADLLLSDDGQDTTMKASKKKGPFQNKMVLGLIGLIIAILGYVIFTVIKNKK
jgi:hypothetical protein